MQYTTSTLLYQKNWISMNSTTPRGVTSSKAIVVTLVSSNTSKAQIFLTLSSTLHKRLIKANPKIAKDVWDTIEAIFQDNKRTRVVALKGELRMIQMGDQTADEYFSNIDSIITLLNDLGSDVSQDDVVTYAINGLSDKYGSLSLIIAHKEPFLDLSTMRSMVSTDEMRIQNKSPSLSVSTNSSAPQVLLTETPHRVQDTRTNKERDNRNNNKTEVCRNFGQGVCRWGATCRGLDLAAQQQLLSLLQAQNTLLAQYGLSTISIPRTPIGFNNSGGLNVSQQQQALLSGTVQGLTPANGQATFLPQAFNTMTLRDPTDANWNMDTGASSHLNSNATNLSTLFNSCMYLSVLVGDEKSIPVTNTSHNTLPTPYRPLHRNNDYWTRQILLRCDSTSDLYPVTSPSYPQAFLVGQQTWHQQLGHLGSEVLASTCDFLFRFLKQLLSLLFDIIHSDLWTSPLSSVSGIKYYVLFLDHFSHYLWVYSFRNKSDALSKFIHFRAFVKNQFQCDIKSLQCDHGGEFDNNALHQLFATNGITIRFSCLKTSQQNGKSERMIRTINNLIRTLLFQAYLLLYVDDIILTASSTAFLQSIIATLHAEFSMTDLGPLNYFLGISVTRNTSGMFLSQQKYASKLLERAGMLTCNPCRTPVDTDFKLSADGDPVSDPTLYRSLAGGLQYLTFTRPDISFAVQQ
ncbi:ribonuclease H-like domain-containing protein, partial [Tanacetum coccineum]